MKRSFNILYSLDGQEWELKATFYEGHTYGNSTEPLTLVGMDDIMEESVAIFRPRFPEGTQFKLEVMYYDLTQPNRLKLNDEDTYDAFNVILNETQEPTAYLAKLKCLMDNAGMTEKEARLEIATVPIEMEWYYEIGSGLMAVESGAVESGIIYSPYSGELYDDHD